MAGTPSIDPRCHHSVFATLDLLMKSCQQCTTPYCAGSKQAQRSSALACLPYLLARPLSCPLEGHEGVTGQSVDRRTHLNEILQLESGCPQEANPIAMGKVKFHARLARPLDTRDAERGPQQAIASGDTVLDGRAQCQQEGVGEEHKLAAGSEQAGHFWNPPLRISPEACPVL